MLTCAWSLASLVFFFDSSNFLKHLTLPCVSPFRWPSTCNCMNFNSNFKYDSTAEDVCHHAGMNYACML